MNDGEVQHYASSILVKGQQYFATLTNERLIIDGPTSREFKTTSIIAAYPISKRKWARRGDYLLTANLRRKDWTLSIARRGLSPRFNK